MSVRLLTGSLAVAATLALGVSACGGGHPSTASDSSAPGQPVSGGVLRFAMNSDAECLDPHQSQADAAGFFARPILDSLVALDTDGTIHPWLATSWKISPDQKHYTFTLRDGVTFTDGEKFDAAAVKANLDHIVNPATKSQLAANTISTYTGTKVIDATHAQVNFSAPSSAFLPTLASAFLGIEAPNTLKQSPQKLCSKIVGSGPFLSSDGYVPQKGISYTRNPAYDWGPANAAHQGKAYLSGIAVSIVPEDSSRYGALTSGQVDAIASVPPVDVKSLKGTSGFHVQAAQAPGGNYNYYPNTAKGPFTDVRVREAFRAGIDWSTIIDKLYFGVFAAAKGPVGPTTVGYDKAAESSYGTYDPAKANQLLDQAGWTGRDSQGYRTKGGKRLTLLHPYLKAFLREQRGTLLDQIQAAAKSLGIEIVNKNATIPEYIKLSGTGGYDLLDFSWQRDSPDVLRTLFGSASVPTPTRFGTNGARYSNPQVDAWLKQALGETDLAQQAQTYGKVQEQIAKDVAVFPAYVFSYELGSSDKVHGVKFEPQAYPTFYDTWLAGA